MDKHYIAVISCIVAPTDVFTKREHQLLPLRGPPLKNKYILHSCSDLGKIGEDSFWPFVDQTFLLRLKVCG